MCDHTPGYDAYSFTTDGDGIFNVCTNLSSCHTHEVGSGSLYFLVKFWSDWVQICVAAVTWLDRIVHKLFFVKIDE